MFLHSMQLPMPSICCLFSTFFVHQTLSKVDTGEISTVALSRLVVMCLQFHKSPAAFYTLKVAPTSGEVEDQ